MRAFQFEQFGIEHLQQVDVPPAPLAEHEVRIAMRAVSVNFRDILMVRGHYNPKQPLPLVPCSDGAGEVIEIGSAVSRFAVGDHVTSCFFDDWIRRTTNARKHHDLSRWPVPGMLKTEAVIHERAVIAQPKQMSHDEAATLPCAALTAWNALNFCDLSPGDTVLVQGTGGRFDVRVAVRVEDGTERHRDVEQRRKTRPTEIDRSIRRHQL